MIEKIAITENQRISVLKETVKLLVLKTNELVDEIEVLKTNQVSMNNIHDEMSQSITELKQA